MERLKVTTIIWQQFSLQLVLLFAWLSVMTHNCTKQHNITMTSSNVRQACNEISPARTHMLFVVLPCCMLYSHVVSCTHMLYVVLTCCMFYSHVVGCTHMLCVVLTCCRMYSHVVFCSNMLCVVLICSNTYSHVICCTHMLLDALTCCML